MKKQIHLPQPFEYPHRIEISKGDGCFLYDQKGKSYIDFVSNVGVNNLGYNSIAIKKAITKQAGILTNATFSHIGTKDQEELIAMLCKFCGKEFDTGYYAATGSDAVETAVRIAVAKKGKKGKIIALKPGYHGATLGTAFLTSEDMPIKTLFNAPYKVLRANYATNEKETSKCLKALEVMLKSNKDIAAWIIEPILGSAGYVVPAKNFIVGIRKLCNKYNIPLIADEVQSGNFRSGRFLAIENFNVKPDIICLGKSVGAGLPLGIVITSKRFRLKHHHYPTSAGANLLAIAAAKASLKYIQAKKLDKNAAEIGDYIKERLAKMSVDNVRGLGLLVGFDLKSSKQANSTISSARKNGLLLMKGGKKSIRLCPPLIISKNIAKKAMDILEKSI
ncbi:aminotransferase class III-fold pyridoxal phosphate-dependent enzyme [Candidatus Woesearchaeota archaeon]|nr:aminotransferase class III-fold pyridoxal phosphate-dependent enzyme [Candidatus Woesearchaeota archaeon]